MNRYIIIVFLILLSSQCFAPNFPSAGQTTNAPPKGKLEKLHERNGMKVTFDKSASIFILDAFRKTVNKDGIIVDKYDPFKKVLTPNGEEISLEDFAGVININGVPVFLKSNIISLIEAAGILK